MADTLLGRVLDGRYRLLEVLSDAGPRGVIYRALNLKLDREVAVKVFHGPAGASFEEAARKLSCIRHPNVEAIQDFGRLEDDRPYLVTALLDGESMAERMTRPMGQLEVLAMIRDGCAGLAELHSADLVHGDIKPENLFYESHRSGETLKLCDFDLPVLLAARAPAAGPNSARAGVEAHSFIDERMLASSAWIAPEQAKGLTPEPASDLYALGAIAYSCMAARPPFTGEPHVVLSKKIDFDPVSLRDLSFPVDVDREADELILSLIAREAPERPSASSVAEQAEALHAELAMPPMPQPVRSRVPWFGLAATLMGAAALMVAELRSPEQPAPMVSAATGMITIESTPSEAEVYVDGMLLVSAEGRPAVTPLEIHELVYGRSYRIQLRKRHYAFWETEMTMGAGMDGHTFAPQLGVIHSSGPSSMVNYRSPGENPARLTVTGDPHADVYLDHARIGSPPIVDLALLPGEHHLTIKSDTEVRTLLIETEQGDSIRYHVP